MLVWLDRVLGKGGQDRVRGSSFNIIHDLPNLISRTAKQWQNSDNGFRPLNPIPPTCFLQKMSVAHASLILRINHRVP
jgi:hypothetical protein